MTPHLATRVKLTAYAVGYAHENLRKAGIKPPVDDYDVLAAYRD